MESCNTVDLPPDCKEFDVICGRGGGSLRTSGNTAYPEMIMMNRVREIVNDLDEYSNKPPEHPRPPYIRMIMGI